MTVLAPSDEAHTRQAVFEAAKLDGPVYIRVSRLSGRRIHDDGEKMVVGKGNILREGRDVTLVATGTMVEKALDAGESLRKEGIGAEVLEMSTLKPFDDALLARSLRKTGACVTIEEHSRIGGLYSAVSESIGGAIAAPIEWIAIDDRFGESGTYEELLGACKLTIRDIVAKAKDACERKGKPRA
jgi:transketolase